MTLATSPGRRPSASPAIQHLGMLPSMLAVMVLRLDEYAGHHGHAHAAA